MFFLSNELYLKKHGNTQITKYIDIPINDYDYHQGGVPDIAMQTNPNLIYDNLPWSWFLAKSA